MNVRGAGTRLSRCYNSCIMLPRLLILFLLASLVELALLFGLADVFSWRFSLFLVVATAALGGWLAWTQGWRAWLRIRDDLTAGRMPAVALFDAALILAAGVLLVIPGVLTDLVGILLLIPACRRWIRQRLSAWVRSHFTIYTLPPNGQHGPPGRTTIIDSYIVDSDDRKES